MGTGFYLGGKKDLRSDSGPAIPPQRTENRHSDKNSYPCSWHLQSQKPKKWSPGWVAHTPRGCWFHPRSGGGREATALVSHSHFCVPFPLSLPLFLKSMACPQVRIKRTKKHKEVANRTTRVERQYRGKDSRLQEVHTV